MSIEAYFAAQEAAWDALFRGPEMIAPKTYTTIDVSRIAPKPWPWPRTMTASEMADYQELLGAEYRVTRGIVTARGDQVWGESTNVAAGSASSQPQ